MDIKLLALVAIQCLVAAVHGDVTLALFQDNDCVTPVPGSGTTTVTDGSCDTNVSTGWSSAKIVGNDGIDFGTLTFYTKRDCGCPTCGSHGYSRGNFNCLNNFEFVANAVGLYNLYDHLDHVLPRCP